MDSLNLKINVINVLIKLRIENLKFIFIYGNKRIKYIQSPIPNNINFNEAAINTRFTNNKSQSGLAQIYFAIAIDQFEESNGLMEAGGIHKCQDLC